MPLDDAFFRDVEPLRSPLMGTECIGPLLYWMVRGQRPATVVEIGMGYTTPFLARALEDNARDWARDRAAMLAKCTDLAERPITRDGVVRWLETEPPLGAVAYYRTSPRPRLHAVDDLSNPHSSAPRVREALRRLSLESIVEIHDGDARSTRASVLAAAPAIDLLFCDCDRTVHVFDDYWDLVARDGGLFVAHALLGDPGGSAVLDYVLQALEQRGEAFEMLNTVERHKVVQNGLTILRRTSGVVEEAFAPEQGERLKSEAKRLVEEHAGR